jgi:hypothetical protein
VGYPGLPILLTELAAFWEKIKGAFGASGPAHSREHPAHSPESGIDPQVDPFYGQAFRQAVDEIEHDLKHHLNTSAYNQYSPAFRRPFVEGYLSEAFGLGYSEGWCGGADGVLPEGEKSRNGRAMRELISRLYLEPHIAGLGEQKHKDAFCLAVLQCHRLGVQSGKARADRALAVRN